VHATAGDKLFVLENELSDKTLLVLAIGGQPLQKDQPAM